MYDIPAESLTELAPRFLPDPTTMLGLRGLSSDTEAHEGEVVPPASAAVSSDQVAVPPQLLQ